MTAIAISLCFAASLGFAGWVLWLREQRPRSIAEDVAQARSAAAEARAEAAMANSESAEAIARAEDTLSRRFTEQRELLSREYAAALAAIRAEADAVRGDMNALAAAVGLTRNGTKFAQPPINGTPLREVLK